MGNIIGNTTPLNPTSLQVNIEPTYEPTFVPTFEPTLTVGLFSGEISSEFSKPPFKLDTQTLNNLRTLARGGGPDCSDRNTALRKFHFLDFAGETAGHWHHSCAKINDKHYANTDFTEHTGTATASGSIIYLDRQSIYCPDNQFLTSFKPLTSGEDDIMIKYSCAEFSAQYDRKTECRDESTQFNDPGYSLVFLDRHRVHCNNDEGLIGFKGETTWPEGRFRINYTCCKASVRFPTPVPTLAPTPEPSEQPISSPTFAPSYITPTNEPVSDPTIAPVTTPTLAPTKYDTLTCAFTFESGITRVKVPEGCVFFGENDINFNKQRLMDTPAIYVCTNPFFQIKLNTEDLKRYGLVDKETGVSLISSIVAGKSTYIQFFSEDNQTGLQGVFSHDRKDPLFQYKYNSKENANDNVKSVIVTSTSNVVPQNCQDLIYSDKMKFRQLDF